LSGLFAADGSWNVTVVSGSSYTGLMAADGSVNVVSSPGSSYVGAYHPCGALYVTKITASPTSSSIRAIDGSLNVSVSPYVTPNSQRITVVGGSFGPSTPGALIPIIIF